MEKLFIVLAVGFAAGYLLRKDARMEKLSIIGIDVFLFLMILALGYSLGQNQAVMGSIASIGLDGLLIAASTIAGSILFVLPLRRYLEHRDR